MGISIADIAAGMFAFSGILTALLQRGRTGEGTTVEVSLFDALAEWMSQPAYFTVGGGRAPARAGARHASIAPYGPFATADGEPVYLAVQNDREWARFCQNVLGRPDLETDPRFDSNPNRVRNRDDLDRLIGDALRGRTTAQVLAALDEAGIACARMNTMEEFVSHPQLVERGRWHEVGSPAGSLRVLMPPVSIAGQQPRLDPVPALGEHTDTILGELGIPAATVAGWRRRGIV